MMIAPLVARTVPDGAIHCSGAAGAHETGERPQHSAAAGSGSGPPHASGRRSPARGGGGGGGGARRGARRGRGGGGRGGPPRRGGGAGPGGGGGGGGERKCVRRADVEARQRAGDTMRAVEPRGRSAPRAPSPCASC